MEPIFKIIFSIFVLIGYFFTLSHSNYLTQFKPIINSTHDEVVVDANRHLTLYCEGKEPITWTFPNNTLYDNEFWSTVTISVSESPGAAYGYRALLHLKNASYVDTGYYYCHGNRSDKDDKYRSSKIYVYVRDEAHLSVSDIDDMQVLRVPQHSTVTLPCLRTSPDVTVALTCDGDEINYFSYDPKAGFVLKITSLLQACDYECVFTLNNSTESQLWFLQVIPKTDYVPKPHIDAPDNGRTAIGKQYVLNCSVTVEPDVFFSLQWSIPNEAGRKNGRIVATNSTNVSNLNGKLGSSTLTITNVKIEDQGLYKCSVTDHSKNTNIASKKIMVYDEGQSYINITEKHGVHIINTTAGTESVQWLINVEAYPKPKLTWKNNEGQVIDPRWADSKGGKYSINTSSSDAFLKIIQITLNDSGTYQLIAENGLEEKVLNLTLLVSDSPTVHIISDHYHKYGDESHLICKAAGNPLPIIQWMYKPCQDNSCTFKRIVSNHTEKVGLMTISHLNLTATETGYVQCSAKNVLGEDTNTIGFYVTDINNGFDIWGLQDGEKVALNETVSVHCAASVYNYTDEINWYHLSEKNPKPILTDDKYYVLRSSSNFTHQVSMTINSISYNESGMYRCIMLPKDEDEEEKQLDISIIVTDPKKPKIIKSNMNNTEIKLELGRPLEWQCYAEGIPAPTITWKKNGQDWSKKINYTRVRLLNDNRMLIFNYTLQEDEGSYTCRASNREGWDERNMQLVLLTKSVWTATYICIVVLFFVCLIILIIILCVKVKKEKKLKNELKVAGLMHFEKGALENLNPELGIDDQAELLPYDRKWEFPRDKLKLGKQLGSGAFGVVMKAEAIGITEGETISTVAVKMVKRNADYTYIKALASELKIMVHLGKHLNVVNLLGACTKNVTKRELFVIVEYCRFGNLHNYLLRHRVDFIDQIDAKTGSIDTTIGADILSRTLSISSNHSDARTMHCAGVDYRSTPNPSSTTDSTIVCSPTGDDSVILSNNSVQPEWRSNYKGDYKGNVRPISTHDLLCWAFQVARGMEYLASRKILHGDLATRNILLSEENIVKICDFGLAKSMYKSDNYKKKGDGPLPVKWMAVESIRDRVFSTQSDVWSYGIVLWEFFSLARTPYPGMEADERLYNKLVEGFRMDQPEFATKDLYRTMLDCWDAQPTNRPTFTVLAENLGCMLQESVRRHYIELNDPYIHMNNERLVEGHSDYLAMLSSPDYGNLASPSHEYVNGGPITDQGKEAEADAEASGYLPMDIFSPRTPDTMFDFDLHKKQKGNGEVASGIELLPILHTQNESDSEPTSPSKSFANPSYQTAPIVSKSTEANIKQIVPTSDNYINMPQQKNAMRNETPSLDNFSNPGYVQMPQIDTKDDNNSSNYINSQSRDWDRPYL